jgi:hypothetical protein
MGATAFCERLLMAWRWGVAWEFFYEDGAII